MQLTLIKVLGSSKISSWAASYPRGRDFGGLRSLVENVGGEQSKCQQGLICKGKES
jgi:hypothetical protein